MKQLYRILLLISGIFLFNCAVLAAPNLTLSVLVDDTVASNKFEAEHGLSILAELPNGNRWLIDTGTTNLFLENAKRLGVNLDNLKGITISHSHDDHTGGLVFYPKLKGSPPIYGHPYIWHKSYQITKGRPIRVLSMPYLARKYAAPHFHPVNNTKELDENFYFFTDIPREPGSFASSSNAFFNEDGTGPVPLIDDATVVIKTPKGLVVILGCAHAGYTNILKAINKQFPNDKLLALIGGSQFKNTPENVWADIVALIRKLKAPEFYFYGGHCTGDKAAEYLRKALGDKVVKPLGAGRVIQF